MRVCKFRRSIFCDKNRFVWKKKERLDRERKTRTINHSETERNRRRIYEIAQRGVMSIKIPIRRVASDFSTRSRRDRYNLITGCREKSKITARSRTVIDKKPGGFPEEYRKEFRGIELLPFRIFSIDRCLYLDQSSSPMIRRTNVKRKYSYLRILLPSDLRMRIRFYSINERFFIFVVRKKKKVTGKYYHWTETR